MTETAPAPITADDGGGSLLLSLQDIHVTFGGTVALVEETFDVRPGEIVGLLGHNGAGKSTLVNVATGAVRPQRGRMFVDGAEIPLRGDPRDTERAGIKVIHQVPALADNLSVADNITLGRNQEKLSRRERRRLAVSALRLLGSTMNVDRPVGSLEFGEKQIVDLARALSANLRVLFLDEPTGALGQREADRLHQLLLKLAQQQRGIVYVSHRLRDILSVCTRLVVLRSGRIVLDRDARNFGMAELSEALAPGMKGKAEKATASLDATPILNVRYHDHPMEFRQGEIVGLFGMAAGPQFRMFEALFGLGEPTAAELEGTPYAPRAPRDAMAHGIYYVSANRERDGLLNEMSALDNLVLPWLDRHKRFGSYSRSIAERTYHQVERSLNVRGGHRHAPVGALSGGNRQKIVVGRWIFGDRPKVLLLSQPTQGVDIGARADIAHALRRLAGDGITILVASSEADEIDLLCDRAYICEGEIWQQSAPGPNWEERLLEGLVRQANR